MKQVKVCLGRFAPFTLGHLKMATYKDLKGPDSDQKNALREQPDLKEIAKQKTVILAISTPQDKVDTRHPFSDDIMKEEWDLIKKNYKNEIEDVFYIKSADICAWGELLKEKGYQASVWLTGSDEYKMYKMMSIKVPEYEEKNRDNRDVKGAYTRSFYVEEIERTEGKDFVSSISGTKVRQALLDGDEELFTKMMPKGANKYFDKFKEAVENAPEPRKKTKKVKEGMTPLVQFIKESLVQENFYEKEFKVLYNAIENKDAKKLIDFIKKTYRNRQDGDLYDDFERLNQDENSTVCALKKGNKEAIIATKEYGDWTGAWVHDNTIEYIETEVFDMIDKTWKAWHLYEYDDELELIISQSLI